MKNIYIIIFAKNYLFLKQLFQNKQFKVNQKRNEKYEEKNAKYLTSNQINYISIKA